MRNGLVLLLAMLAMLAMLVAREGGVEAYQCYSCSNCNSPLGTNVPTKSCSSCLTTVNCQANGNHFVNRVCSLTNKNTGCVRSASSADSYECYCNEDKCDALAANPNLCNTATTSAATFTFVLASVVLFLLTV